MAHFFKSFINLKLNTRIILILGLLVHLITSYFSIGFQHPDEQYQIIEPINVLLDKISINEMPWDYRYKFRPWLQTITYFGLQRFLNFFGENNPFHIATFFRIFSSLLGWSSLILFTFFFVEKFEIKKKLNQALLLSNFIWFIPFLHARTSQENFSSAIFIFGLLTFFSKRKYSLGFLSNYLFSGLLMGFAFELRFQMGVPILALFLWNLIINKEKFLKMIPYTIGIFLAFSSMLLMDSYLYGELVLAPWNYVWFNLGKKMAEQFGVYPWWYYFKLIFLKGIPPFSIILMAGVSLYWVIYRRSFLTWITIPFLVIHLFIGHKELRFLNFIYFFAPLMSLYIYEMKYKSFLDKRGFKLFFKYFLVPINLLLVFVLMFKPAHSPISFYQYIYNNYKDGSQFRVFKGQGDAGL